MELAESYRLGCAFFAFFLHAERSCVRKRHDARLWPVHLQLLHRIATLRLLGGHLSCAAGDAFRFDPALLVRDGPQLAPFTEAEEEAEEAEAEAEEAEEEAAAEEEEAEEEEEEESCRSAAASFKSASSVPCSASWLRFTLTFLRRALTPSDMKESSKSSRVGH